MQLIKQFHIKCMQEKEKNKFDYVVIVTSNVKKDILKNLI